MTKTQTLLFASAFLLTTNGAAMEPVRPWDLSFPSVQEQYQSAKLDEMAQGFRTDPYFAGKLVEIAAFGKKVKVDRRHEPNSSPNTPPPAGSGALMSLTDVLDGLDAQAKAQVQIGVKREWYETGVLKEENWTIVVNGSYHVVKEELASDKEDKKTGEAE